MDGLYPEWDEFYLLVCDICGIVIRPQALKKHLATKHRINVQDQAQPEQPQAFQKQNQQHNHHSPQSQPQQQPQNNHHHQQQQQQQQQQPQQQPQQQQHQSLPPPPQPPQPPHQQQQQQLPKTNNINQTLPNNHNSTNSTHSTSSNSCVNNRPQTNGIAQQQQQQHHHHHHHHHQQPIISQPKLWGGKHALNSLPKPAIKRRPCDWVKVRRAPVTNLDQLGSFVTKASHTVDNSSLAGSGMLHFNEFYGDVSSKTSSKYQDRKWRNTFNVLRDAFF